MGIGSQTLKHTLIYSAANVLGGLAGFIMLPFYAHLFRAEGYGIIAMLDTSLGIFTVLLAGGFHTAILRTYHGRQDDDGKAALGSGIALVWALAAAMVVLPMIFSVPLSGLLLGSEEHYGILCLALLTFVIDVAGQSATTVHIIRQRSLLLTVVSLIRLAVGLALNVWLVVVLEVGLAGFFVSSLITATATSLTFHLLAAREGLLKFDRQAAIEILRFQLPMLPGDLATFLGRQAERVVVRMLTGLQSMGILEMAYKFPPLLILFIAAPFSRAWNTKCIEIAGQDEAPRIIGEMFERFLFVMVFAGLVLALSIDDVLALLTPVEFWNAARIVKIEVVTTILGACTTYLSFGLLYHRRTGVLSRIRLTLAPLKIALAFALITAFGLSGAAYSALLVEVAALVWISGRSQALYRVSFDYGRLLGIVVAGAGLFVLLDGNTYSEFPPAVYAREHWPAALFHYLDAGLLADLDGEKLLHLVALALNALFSLAFLTLVPLFGRRPRMP